MQESNIDILKEKMKDILDPKRYVHTLHVMMTAESLAEYYHVDVEKARLAGLLHDCAKHIPSEEKIRMCEEHHLPVSESERMYPELLHAKLGAYLAKELYHIEDQEILDAITYHTTGRPCMTLLDKIVYIADYIEPGRKEAPNLELLRHMVYDDIDACLYQILSDSLAYLASRSGVVDPLTEQTYNYYKERR